MKDPGALDVHRDLLISYSDNPAERIFKMSVLDAGIVGVKVFCNRTDLVLIHHIVLSVDPHAADRRNDGCRARTEDLSDAAVLEAGLQLIDMDPFFFDRVT